MVSLLTLIHLVTSLCGLSIFCQNQEKKEVNVVAMIPLLFSQDKYCFKSAMRLAVQYINKDDSILKGYTLIIDYQDSSVSYAALTKLNEDAFVDKDESKTGRLNKTYPFFLRTSPSIVSFNKAKVGIFQHFGWKKIAILYEYDEAQFFTAATGLSDLLNENGVEVLAVQGFSNEALNVSSQLKILEILDARIIVGFFGETGMRKIFCEAYRRGMYGTKYKWIIDNWISPTWYNQSLDDSNCSQAEYLKSADGYLAVSRSAVRRDNTLTIANVSAQEIWEKIKLNKLEEWNNFYLSQNKTIKPMPESEYYRESTFAFDAVYTVALGLNKSILSDGPVKEYKNSTRAVQVTEDMLGSEFEGVTGHLSYDKISEERLGEVLISQFCSIGNHTRGQIHDVGYFIVSKKTLTFSDNQSGLTLFQDRKITRDSLTKTRVAKTFSAGLLGVMWVLSSFGLLLSVTFLFINVQYRNIRLIKMSSPNINNGIIAGCIISYITSFVYGFDSRIAYPDQIAVACNTSYFTLALGFTISYGSLFSKTWRIYKIFTAAKSMERVTIRDFHLYTIIICLVTIDMVIYVFWITFSPFKVIEHDLETIVTGDNVNVYYYHKCVSEHQMSFFVVVYCYKGFLLVFGLFLAWETRNVKVAVLNDSKFIGIAVYIVCIMSAVGVTSVTALNSTNNYSSGFVIVTLCIFICTSCTLLLIFVPKVLMLFAKSFFAKSLDIT